MCAIQNEFLSPKYADLIGRGQTEGQAILGVLEMYTDGAWIWIGAGYCACFFFLFVVCAGFAAGFIQVVENAGTSRKRQDGDDTGVVTIKVVPLPSQFSSENNDALPKAVASPSSVSSPRTVLSSSRAKDAVGSALPLAPMSIAWRGIHYVAPKSEKILIHSVSGFAEPGSMTALMGASGAGQLAVKTLKCVPSN